MEDFFENLKISSLSEDELKRLSSVKFAYIGDAVYEVYIRNYILVINKNKINEINKVVVKYVRASAQAYAAKNLESFLTEKEWGTIKWGRNQKTASSPKNANITEYKYATGFETLIGMLFLKQDKERLEEIISKAIFLIENMEAK